MSLDLLMALGIIYMLCYERSDKNGKRKCSSKNRTGYQAKD